MDRTALQTLHKKIAPAIRARLAEFRAVLKNGSDYDVFKELVFCLFTPQSGSKICWETAQRLDAAGLIAGGSEAEIAAAINTVRFRYNKARYVVEARERFSAQGSFSAAGHSIKEFIQSFKDSFALREAIHSSIKGLGLKEASHFLRNIGMGGDFAILDRHILRCMVEFGVIDALPKSISPALYHSLETALREFSADLDIPLEHMDMVLWYRVKEEVFK
jgi:N-glycosylase/DNA lyase